MLYIEYDPEGGTPVEDGYVEAWSLRYIQNAKANSSTDIHLSFSSQIMIDAFRVHIKEGKIDCKDIVLVSNGRELPMDKNGRMRNYPCHIWNRLMLRLL